MQTHTYPFLRRPLVSLFFLTLFISLCFFSISRDILTCPPAHSRVCCQCFSFCQSQHTPKRPHPLAIFFLSFDFSFTFSITDAFPWLFLFQRDRHAQLLMIQPTDISSPNITTHLSEGETTNNNNVRLKGGALRRNLTAFLGSALSVAPLLPWLPIKSFLCLFVAKFFCLFFPSKTSFVSGHVGARMMENVGTCCPDSRVLCQIPVPSFGGLRDISLARYSPRTSHPLFILHIS